MPYFCNHSPSNYSACSLTYPSSMGSSATHHAPLLPTIAAYHYHDTSQSQQAKAGGPGTPFVRTRGTSFTKASKVAPHTHMARLELTEEMPMHLRHDLTPVAKRVREVVS